MRPSDLETLVHRELQQLPLPRAPYTLLPRVMAAVQEWTLRPWYARAWFTWPLQWQVASITALVAIVVAVAVLLPGVQAVAVSGVSRLVAQPLGDVAGIAQQVQTTTSAAEVLWRLLLQPLVGYAFAVVVLMCLACVAFGAALNYVVIERAYQR
jgi:hypothetical protein